MCSSKEWSQECKFRGVDKVTIKTVVVTERLIGEGTPDSPLRYLTQIWDMNGELIASSLPLNETGVVDLAYRCPSR